jgi:hypothetical protein
MNSVLLLEKDSQKRTETVAKILGVLDNFLNPYPQDGGCDEGPGYWGAAAASLFDNIAMLNLASNNSFDYVYQDEKFRNMGRFIYQAQIGPKYFLNFADADPQPGMAADMIYRFGRAIQDEDMMKFGAYYRTPEDGSIGTFQYFRNYFALFIQKEYRSSEQGLPLPDDTWVPDLHVMISRDKPGSTDGFFVAAKGGNNDESHNHNDIGNYIVYYNGLPVLIDVGRGTYTRKTFSDQRYDIWYNCSDYHNLATVNGIDQKEGANFKANSVVYKTKKGLSQLTLDIAKSYPDDAGIINYFRRIRLNKGQNVTIDDLVKLSKAESLVQHLMTCYPAKVKKPGELVIHFAPDGGTPEDFVVKYNPAQFDVSVEKIELEAMEDEGIRKKWGDTIHRINLTAKKLKANNQFRMEITKM